MIFNKIIILGLGLIGGSLAKSIKNKELNSKIDKIEIFAYDLNKHILEKAKKDFIIDGYFDNLKIIDFSIFDLIIITSPLSTYNELIIQINKTNNLKNIIIDCGSIKDITKIMNKNIKIPQNLILCHPIAGSNLSGFENSLSDLFDNKNLIITTQETDLNKDKIDKLQNFFQELNIKTSFMDGKMHDKIYALISHLPQFLSFLTIEDEIDELVDEEQIDKEQTENKTIKTLKKIFRLNSSNPKIWEEIFKYNEQHIEKYYIEFYDNFIENKNLFKQNYNTFLSNVQDNLINIQIDNQISEIEFNLTEQIISKNFTKIFLRFIVVYSYLNIKDIENFSKYKGTGFIDFSLIYHLFNFILHNKSNNARLIELINKNHKQIIKIIEKY